MLAAPLGSTLLIQAKGEDRQAVLTALKNLVDARFDEAE